MAQVYDPESGQMIDQYDLFLKRRAAKKSADNSGVEMAPGSEVGPGVAKEDFFGNSNLTQNDTVPGKEAASSPGMGAAQGANAAIQSNSAGGSKTATLGAGLTAAGTATANPYLIGAGLVLSSAASINKSKNDRQQNRYLAEMQKYQARQQAIQNMASIGANLKA